LIIVSGLVPIVQNRPKSGPKAKIGRNLITDIIDSIKLTIAKIGLESAQWLVTMLVILTNRLVFKLKRANLLVLLIPLVIISQLERERERVL